MFSRIAGSLLATSLLLHPAVVQAQAFRNEARVVFAGRTQKIGYFGSIDPDCRPLPRSSVALIEPPRFGRVTTQAGLAYPNFRPDNPRFRCSTRKSPATLLFYTAAPGFTGMDSFAIEVVGDLGVPRRLRYSIAVR